MGNTEQWLCIYITGKQNSILYAIMCSASGNISCIINGTHREVLISRIQRGNRDSLFLSRNMKHVWNWLKH